MNEITAAPLISNAGIGIMILKSLGMLCLVLGILMGILYVVKRVTQTQTGRRDRSMIRHLSTFYLAPKERVVLLDVMGRNILIGVTPQTITHLTEIESMDEGLPPEEQAPHEPFLKSLLSRLAKDRHNEEDGGKTTLHKAGA